MGNSPRSHLLASEVRRFADKEIRPHAAQLDHDEAFPAEIYAKMAEFGMFGIAVPAEHGGAGLGMVDFCAAMEELSRGYSSVADQCGLVELLAGLLVSYGSEAQIATWMEPLLKAQARGSICVTESEAGSDVSAIRTAAERNDSGWTLSGSKMWIHNAPVCDVAFVLARTDAAAGRRGMSIFIVDCSLPGVVRGPKKNKMGQRASYVGELSFTDVRLPGEALLGEEGRGFRMMMEILNAGRVGVASLAVGIAQAGLEACIAHAKKRKQFGSPIADLQAIQLMLADMAKDIEAARLLAHSAAAKLDSKDDATAVCAMAKCFASDMAVQHTANAVQIFGGSGYIRGSEVERLYRDAKITQIYEGTNQIQRLIIARNLLN